MGVIMGEFGVAMFLIVIGVFAGLLIGSTYTYVKYNKQISICSSNEFSYQKCGELYGWDLK